MHRNKVLGCMKKEMVLKLISDILLHTGSCIGSYEKNNIYCNLRMGCDRKEICKSITEKLKELRGD